MDQLLVRQLGDVLWTTVLFSYLLVNMGCSPFETLYASKPLDSIEGLELHASTAEVVELAGAAALRLEGMVLLPELKLVNAGIEVEILAEQPCYPGIVFRLADQDSYELAYAVPHASGLPDAIQYDPVFGGCNTWQLHSGAAYQQRAEVPMGRWFTLRIDVEEERAVIRVDDQEPLVVERLARETRAGRVGLWSFRPAHFRNLRVALHRRLDDLNGVMPAAPAGAVTAWHLEGNGPVTCEPNGVLNLNRYLAPTVGEVRLQRRFVTASAGEVALGLGFSDTVSVRLDGELLFEGSSTFKGFEDLSDRGWVQLGPEPLRARLEAGEHVLETTLGLTEPFGWGQIVTLRGAGLALLPVAGS